MTPMEVSQIVHQELEKRDVVSKAEVINTINEQYEKHPISHKMVEAIHSAIAPTITAEMAPVQTTMISVEKNITELWSQHNKKDDEDNKRDIKLSNIANTGKIAMAVGAGIVGTITYLVDKVLEIADIIK